MKERINLDTQKAICDFVGIASRLNEKITITDNNGLTVSAKSMLGTMYAKVEFNELWLECENDRYFEFKEFIINE